MSIRGSLKRIKKLRVMIVVATCLGINHHEVFASGWHVGSSDLAYLISMRDELNLSNISDGSNQAPVIYANDRVIATGYAFDPMLNVTAADAEDGILTSKLRVIRNTVKSDVAGTYEVAYSVTDKQKATTTKTITVSVVNAFELSGIENVEVKQSDVNSFDPLSGVSVMSKDHNFFKIDVTGQITEIDVINASQTFHLFYTVTHPLGLARTRIREVTVTNHAPRLLTKNNIVSSGSEIELSHLMTALDHEDGDLTDHIEYNVLNKKDLANGDFIVDVTFFVTDSDGNEASLTQSITVLHYQNN